MVKFNNKNTNEMTNQQEKNIYSLTQKSDIAPPKPYKNINSYDKNETKMNIRINPHELERIKQHARKYGLKYQTFVKSIIHKYITGQLIEKEENLNDYYADVYTKVSDVISVYRSKIEEAQTTETLFQHIHSVLSQAKETSYQTVNSEMIKAYWQIGRLIVENLETDEEESTFDTSVLKDLSQRLIAEFGQGFSVQSLNTMRQFYLLFQDTPPRNELTWTHYKLLIKVDESNAREWYMNEAADENWSTRQLDRQISTQYYERLLMSRNKNTVRKEAEQKLSTYEPEAFIHDPYVLEFLELQDYPDLRESDLETAIINNLQHFLLELGKGFSFIARQKRIRYENEDFYIDLVFYNYRLKCFVLIDLKIGKLTYQDIGQMDSYIKLYEEKYKVAEDNPTIGLILCSQKNEAMARYSILSDSKQLFASKYKLYLPSEDELQKELKRERKLLENRQLNKKN